MTSHMKIRSSYLFRTRRRPRLYPFHFLSQTQKQAGECKIFLGKKGSSSWMGGHCTGSWRWASYVAGLRSVSVFLWWSWVLSGGRVDIKKTGSYRPSPDRSDTITEDILLWHPELVATQLLVRVPFLKNSVFWSVSIC